MLAPAMGQLSINFVTDERYPCLACPECKRFHISPIKHTPRGIAWGVHKQDARIGSISTSLDHGLRKGLWSQTMMIVWLRLYTDHAPTGQLCHRSIADPRRNRQEHVPFEDVQECIEQRFASWANHDLLSGTRHPSCACEISRDGPTKCRYPQNRGIASVCCSFSQCRFQQGMQRKCRFTKAQMNRLKARSTPLRHRFIHSKRCRGGKCLCCRCQAQRCRCRCSIDMWVSRVHGMHRCFLCSLFLLRQFFRMMAARAITTIHGRDIVSLVPTTDVIYYHE